MAKLNQLKAGVVLSYLSTGLNMIIQLVYTPVMLRLLGQSEYGLYTLVGSVVSYLSLFSLGFTAAYLRFYSRYSVIDDRSGEARLNGMFLMIFTAMAVVALACGMLLSMYPKQVFGGKLSAEELKKSQVLMRILVINIVLTFPSGLLDSIISAHEKFVFQRTLSLISVIINPMISLPLLLLGHGSIALVCVTTTVTVVKLLVSVWYCKRKLHVQFALRGVESKLLGEIAEFSIFIFLGMIVDQVNWTVDKLVLGRVSGTKAVAVYGVGSQINSLFLGFATTISSVFVPRVNKIAAQNKKDKNQEFTTLLIRVGRIQFLILALMGSGFIIFGRYFITDIYSTKEYSEAYAVALLLVIPGMISLIQNLGIEIQRAVNKHRFMTYVYCVMALLNAVISVPLAMWLGPTGSALGTAVCLVLANGVFMNVYYKKVINLDITLFWKNILALSKGLIIPGFVGVYLCRYVVFNSLMQYALLVVIYTTVYCCSMWWFGMNSSEKALVLRPLMILRSKNAAK